MPDVRLVAVVDCYQNRRETFAKTANEQYGGNVCATYRDFREVVARKDIDGVIISTPDHWHVLMALAAARAGKDMYLEKPLGVALAGASKLRKELARHKVVFQYGTQQRGDQTQFRRACELVRNGHIGKVHRVDAWCPDMSTHFQLASVPPYGSTKPIDVPAGMDYDLWFGPAPRKPYTADRCANGGRYHIYDYALGFISNWGAHPLDIAQWGLNMDHTGPVHYEGSGKFPPKGSLWDTIESWDVHCEYADGVKLHYMGSRVAQPVVAAYHPAWCPHGTTFFGDEGWINVNRSALYASNKALQKTKTKPEELHLTDAPSHARNFVDCMKSRLPTVSPLESAIRSYTIGHLSDISIRLGRAIQWDPQKEQIVGDAEASKLLDRPMRAPWGLE